MGTADTWRKVAVSLMLLLALVGCTQSLKEPSPSELNPTYHCGIDSDCVPNKCCGADGTVNKQFGPDCSLINCVAMCLGPLDCVAGYPACINGKCGIRNADGSVY